VLGEGVGERRGVIIKPLVLYGKRILSFSVKKCSFGN
jgi:hypothetical protein